MRSKSVGTGAYEYDAYTCTSCNNNTRAYTNTIRIYNTGAYTPIQLIYTRVYMCTSRIYNTCC